MSAHREGAASTEVARLDKFSGFMWLVAVLAGVAFCGAVYAYWSYFWDQRKPIERLAQWGQLGDFLGGSLNPLISLFALIALLATFRVQIKELKIATGEAAIASAALEKQSVTLEDQLSHSQQQARFEGVERAAANTAMRIDALLAPSHRLSGLVHELFREFDELGWEGFDGDDTALRTSHLPHRQRLLGMADLQQV